MTTEEFKNTYLEDGEELLWSGSPETLKYFSRTDICLVPITLILGWFLITYAYASFMLMMQGKSVAFALSGITILLIAFYLVIGRIWYRHKRLSRNLYFVTSKRVLVFNTLRDTLTADIPLEETSPEAFKNDLFLSYKALGGDIVYGLGLDIFFRNIASETPAFYAISDPQKIGKLITKAKKAKKAKKANKAKTTNDRKDNSDDSDFI